jgi:polyisoprenyl-teichoic acid--peptidoglycan teichoic acid transferase
MIASVRRAAAALFVLVLIAACSPSVVTESSSTSVTTTSTTSPTTTTTTEARPTTTTTPPPIVLISVSGIEDGELTAAVGLGLSTIRDPRVAGDVIEGVVAHHEGPASVLADSYTAEATVAELADGSRVAVATLEGGDILLLADEGQGWVTVGAHLGSIGADPYYGEPPRRVLVLGSDARPGGDASVHRMDSIHILTSVPSERAASILGYPRDSWIDSEYGSMRMNALTSSGRGPDALFEFFTDTWEVPLEGYILTGFAGFEDLVGAAFGRLRLTIPIPIPTQEWFDGFSSGEQTLDPTRLLDFARTRKLIPGGDFTRSYHHGIVMLAALATIQEGSIHDLPSLLAILSRFTETNLTATDLLQLGAAAFELDPGAITNEVLPGSLGRAGGGASVVFLDPGFELIVADVIDDGLRNDSAG